MWEAISLIFGVCGFRSAIFFCNRLREEQTNTMNIRHRLWIEISL